MDAEVRNPCLWAPEPAWPVEERRFASVLVEGKKLDIEVKQGLLCHRMTVEASSCCFAEGLKTHIEGWKGWNCQ